MVVAPHLAMVEARRGDAGYAALVRMGERGGVPGVPILQGNDSNKMNTHMCVCVCVCVCVSERARWGRNGQEGYANIVMARTDIEEPRR